MKHITVPKLKINTKVLLITAGALLVLALFTVAVIAQVKNEKAEALQRAETAQKQEQATNELKAKLAASEKATATVETENEAICSWVRSVTPRYKIAVPPLCIK